MHSSRKYAAVNAVGVNWYSFSGRAPSKRTTGSMLSMRTFLINSVRSKCGSMGLPCPVTAVLECPEYPSIENNREVFEGVRKVWSGERIAIQFASMRRASYGDR